MSVDGQVTSGHRASPDLGLRVWGRSGLVLDPDYISGSSGGMSLYSGSWIGLLRYQLTHLQVDSGNVRYRQYAPFLSIQALPISSDNKAFHGLNALKFPSNPTHRFCYNHRMPRKPRQREVI